MYTWYDMMTMNRIKTNKIANGKSYVCQLLSSIYVCFWDMNVIEERGWNNIYRRQFDCLEMAWELSDCLIFFYIKNQGLWSGLF